MIYKCLLRLLSSERFVLTVLTGLGSRRVLAEYLAVAGNDD